MTDVVLLYPYFKPRFDSSIFRHQPLGIGYLASYLGSRGYSVDIVDCTFMSETQALAAVERLQPAILGIYAMISVEKNALRLAQKLRQQCQLLVVGGPHATVDPSYFADTFDLIVIGEGEETLAEVVDAYFANRDFFSTAGVAFKKNGDLVVNEKRPFIRDLDCLPNLARELYPNRAYQDYWRKKAGIKPVNIMTTRGCPYHCEYCSKPVFGDTYRERSVHKVMQEVEEVLRLGFDHIFFSDDCFTLNRNRVRTFCEKIKESKLDFNWSLLTRVDAVDKELAQEMKEAGCHTTFLGLESGDDKILTLMGKATTTTEARRAVRTLKEAGIRVGAFFMVGYPGESEDTILSTLRFACSLSLDYLSFTLPYPIPGTLLYERTRELQKPLNWDRPRLSLWEHRYYFSDPFSESKLKFAVGKGISQYYLNKYLGSSLLSRCWESVTDSIFKLM